jgi:bifunctional UDP-N-acetylglucosamine pyrophosphorylase / glucosamine-1-phosphate N-acetyltransferase
MPRPMSVVAVVLAAGLGTRMKSPLAKVLHPILGRPMLGWVLAALDEAGAEPILVVHHQEEAVRAAFPARRFARQEVPRGTGDAVAATLALLPASGPVLVCAGDTPLLPASAFSRLLAEHGDAPCTVASFEAADPTGYGRIVRNGGTRIVEEANATPDERRIREVNSGLYVFDAAYLRAQLPRLVPHPPKGEYYLTDLVQADAKVVAGFPEAMFMGVNDRAQLAEARDALRRRRNRALAAAGVDLESLDGISIDVDVVVAPGARIGLGAVLTGASVVAGEVGPNCVLHDTTVAAGAVLRASCVCEGAEVQAGAVVGPFARLRPKAVIGEGAHIGNFVEVKNTRVGPGAKANHLAYLGDAELGAGANYGAGAITCNYDGVRKNRTVIGAGAFIGSNAALVAPVEVGDGAIVGAGSVITQTVPADAIAISRAPQKVALGSAARLRQRYKALKEQSG